MCIAQNVQKQYGFDHLLEYEFREEMDSPIETIYYLTNSKNNNFHVYAKNRKEIGDSLLVQFVDYKGDTFSKFHLSKSDFLKQDFLLNCKIVRNFNNPSKLQHKYYHFVNERDTILEEEKFAVFVLKNEKEKREKRKKECRFHYVLEKNTGYHQANFFFHRADEEWRRERSIPNGIPKLMYHTSNFQNDHHIFKLKKITEINKNLEITGDCK